MNFGDSVTSRDEGDLNFDGIVDFADFRTWKDNRPPGIVASLAVPEPQHLLIGSEGGQYEGDVIIEGNA